MLYVLLFLGSDMINLTNDSDVVPSNKSKRNQSKSYAPNDQDGTIVSISKKILK